MIYDIFFAVCKWNFSCDCLLLKLRPVSLSRALPVEEMYSVPFPSAPVNVGPVGQLIKMTLRLKL